MRERLEKEGIFLSFLFIDSRGSIDKVRIYIDSSGRKSGAAFPGVQTGALLLALLVAFPLAAEATGGPAAVGRREATPRADGYVPAPTPLLSPSPKPAPPPAIVQLPPAIMVPAAQKAAPPAPVPPSLVAPASEKLPDRVFSPVDVDRLVNTSQWDDPDDADRDGFFDTASEEVGRARTAISPG